MPSPPRPPLSQGNALQRRYAAWAAPHYARMPEHLREPAERLDRWLYSRDGLWLWLGLLATLAAGTVSLVLLGLGWPVALLVSAMLLSFLVLMLLAAWLVPDKFTAPLLARSSLKVVLLAYLGGLLGFLAGRMARHGDLRLDTLGPALTGAAVKAAPILPAVVLTVLLMLWGVAQIRRLQSQRELAAVRQSQERDATARQAAEARLHLLQAQIQPHFIFNTLAALQHAVDTGDPGAGALLRSLTAFLRGSTELLGRTQTTLGEEAAVVGHYLAIMSARLGTRLRHQVDVPANLAERCLPPGLLLTLVENAVEHGVSPALRGARVCVQARQLPPGQGWTLCVRDDGAGLLPGWQDGVGLANCRQRLAHHFGPRAVLLLRSVEVGGQPVTEACITFSENTDP